jgi:hypothetical protein
MIIPNMWKIMHVPNHQPVIVLQNYQKIYTFVRRCFLHIPHLLMATSRLLRVQVGSHADLNVLTKISKKTTSEYLYQPLTFKFHSAINGGLATRTGSSVRVANSLERLVGV